MIDYRPAYPPTPKRGRFQNKKREICESTAIALNIHIDTIEVHHTTMYNCVDVYLFHEKIHNQVCYRQNVFFPESDGQWQSHKSEPAEQVS
jgi:hypothetical protein